MMASPFIMSSVILLLLAFLLGFLTGLRALTPPAVVAWTAHQGWISLQGTPLAFMDSTMALGIFSALALVELVVDKLPWAPNRTDPFGLICRLAFGTLVGVSLVLAGHQSPYLGGLLGATGALLGTFAGFQARTRLVKKLSAPDIAIALIEDSMTIVGAMLIISRFPR